MSKPKKGITLEEKANLILERIRNAGSIKDFDVLLSNLIVIEKFIEDNNSELTANADLYAKLEACKHRLEFSVEKEKTRRNEITTLGEKYNTSKKQLSKCDEARMLYVDILNAPEARTFSYSASLSSTKLEDKVLIDYFNNITDALGLPRGSVNTLDALNAKIAAVELDMDKYAFDINKANGLIDAEIVTKDKATVDILVLRSQLKAMNKDLYNKTYIGIKNDPKKELTTAINSTTNSTFKKQLEQFKKGREFFENHSNLLKYIEDDIYDTDNTLILENLKEKLDELNKNIAAGNPLSPDEVLLQSHVADLLNYLTADEAIKRSNPTLHNKISQEATPPQGKAAIQARITQLKSIGRRLSKNEHSELTTLQELCGIDDFKPLKRSDLAHLYSRYEVDPTESPLQLQAAIHSFSRNQETQQTINQDKLSAALIRERINTPRASKDNPIPSVGDPIAPEKDSGHDKDLDGFTKFLQQTRGYMPRVGRNSVIYARPVFDKGFLGLPSKKIKKMEFVEESIESIIENPSPSYKAALKEANKKRKALKMQPLDIDALSNIVDDLIRKGDMDEVLKRILSVKCSNTREELEAISSTHSLSTYDKKTKETNFPPITFLNNSDLEQACYDAPKAKKERSNLRIFKKEFPIHITGEKSLWGNFTCDKNTPSTATTYKKQSEYLRFESATRGTGKYVNSINAVKDRTHYTGKLRNKNCDDLEP